MMKTNASANIAVLGTYDTKAVELLFVADVIREHGHVVTLIDVGTMQNPQIKVDITNEEIAASAGIDLATLRAKKDRGRCIAAMAEAVPKFVAKLAKDGKISGIISLGGGGGTAIGTAAMRALPIGFPKLMLSTLASGNTRPYVGTSDIVMFPSVLDIAGLNHVSRMLMTQAAGAICGMVDAATNAAAGAEPDRPVIVASMFGNTTACVTEARRILELGGYEVLVFHATGIGGRTMETLIESGLASGVLDITTTEWADELVGGILSAGPTRLDAAANASVPAIVVPGCLDMVNFGEPDAVPTWFQHRRFHQHNPQVTLMRTTPEECQELGRILAEKANRSTAPCSILLPLRGISALATEGRPFHDPAADEALFGAIRDFIRPGIGLIEVDCDVNDPVFAGACAETLLENMNKG